MHDAPMIVERPVRVQDTPESLLPPAPAYLLSPLSAHLERARTSVPPRVDRLPAEFRGLRAAWARFDRFVGERIEWALSGAALELEETEPDGIAEVRGEIDRLASSDPLASRAFLESFEFLEGALAILRRFLLESCAEVVP